MTRRDRTIETPQGVVFTRIERGLCEARLEIKQHHMAPNGFLHAATVIALADTAAGFGC